MYSVRMTTRTYRPVIVRPDLPGTRVHAAMRHSYGGPEVLACAPSVLLADCSVDEPGTAITCTGCREKVNATILYNVLCAKVEDIRRDDPPGGGGITMRSTAYTTGSCGLMYFSSGNADGTSNVYMIEASVDPRSGDVRVNIEHRWTNNSDEYWARFSGTDSRSVRVDGMHYTIGDPDMPGTRGCGGRRFVIMFTDGPREGERVVTTNLWVQGAIPPVHRTRLSNNAVFVQE